MDFTAVVLLMALLTAVAAFNLSPRPNITLREPQEDGGQPQTRRTSYFGLTMNMRSNSILIGAPRANSTAPLQRVINETGAVYKCSVPVDAGQQAHCAQFTLEGSENIAETSEGNVFNGELRDKQWLGAAMDGGNVESNHFVVCAPRMHTTNKTQTSQLNHGICYWTSETAGDQPKATRKVKPLNALNSEKMYNESPKQKKTRYAMYGEAGFSVHSTGKGEKILIGAPGLVESRGTVIRFSPANNIIDVPDTKTLITDESSYFGYAVSSGNVLSKEHLSYVASAPRANGQRGEVYIFDITGGSNSRITKKLTLTSGQWSEYFGYALVVDDFNKDGWSDVAVAAPLHARDDGGHENGAVYVFRNRDGSGFHEPMVLRSQYIGGGRFGSALSQLGDINKDGYNDLAVGAPYEGNGVVYVYLGGPSGLAAEPSQKLVSPVADTTTLSLFGYGLSKGSDIDANQYLDLAVGAPGADSVFVYRAYPVGKIIASITPDRKSLHTTDTLLGLKVCWHMNTTDPIELRPRFNIDISLDAGHERIQTKNQTNFNVRVGNVEECRSFSVTVAYKSHLTFQPLTFAIHYKLLDEIPADSEVFCTTCVAFNPDDVTFNQSTVSFSTGCKDAICSSDLAVSSNVDHSPYVLGSSKLITIKYTIRNSGEDAYHTQLRVLIGDASLKFLTIPPECVRSSTTSAEMLCTLLQGQKLQNGKETSFSIDFDTTALTGTAFRVRAEVSSNSNETNSSDNVVEDVVALATSSALEIAGKSSLAQVSLGQGVDIVHFEHVLKIQNNGPSMVNEMDVTVLVPTTYLDTKSISVLNAADWSLRTTYDHQISDMQRKQDAPTPRSANESKLVRDAHEELEPFVATLPENRTIFFDCAQPDVGCTRMRFTVFNFKASPVPIVISINMSLSLYQIESILKDQKDTFLLRTSAEIVKKFDEKIPTISAVLTKPYIAILKHSTNAVPVLAYIGSALAGLLVMFVITYTMYKLGFFRRKIKEELKEIKRLSMAVMSMSEPDYELDFGNLGHMDGETKQ